MPTPSFASTLPVHPHQLEVQEFDTYALIVDLRSAEAFAADHLPRAVSVPRATWLLSSARADGALDLDASTLASEETVQGIPYVLEAQLGHLEPGSAVLLYCDQGAAESAAMAGRLRRRRFAVDVLPGGWASYRRWVTAGIEILARALDWRWVRSAPGGISQGVVEALRRRGQQVLGLNALLGSLSTPGLVLDTARVDAPSLDSRLIDTLRRLDPKERVWVDEVTAASNVQALPVPLLEALRHATAWRIDAPADVRVGLLQERLRDAGTSPALLFEALSRAMPAGLATALANLRGQLDRGEVTEAFTILLRDLLDPLYEALAVPTAKDHDNLILARSLTGDDLDRVADELIARQISP